MSIQSHPVAELITHLLQGFAWGLNARKTGSKLNDASALSSGGAGLPEGLLSGLTEAVGRQQQDHGLIGQVDAVLDAYPVFEDLREYLIDLAVLRLISDGAEMEDGDAYFESPAWDKVEEACMDRGTELLNLLVYVKDCRENDLEPSLNDFLNEFLLVQEDQHQDEFFIYEGIIRNQALLDGRTRDLIEAGNAQRDDDMQDLFTPLMLFFKERELKPGKATLAILNYSRSPELHAGIFNLLNRFYLTRENELLN